MQAPLEDGGGHLWTCAVMTALWALSPAACAGERVMPALMSTSATMNPVAHPVVVFRIDWISGLGPGASGTKESPRTSAASPQTAASTNGLASAARNRPTPGSV